MKTGVEREGRGSSSPESGSFHGCRSSWGMSGCEQGSVSSTFRVCEKASGGTLAMWLLSQMMRDSETERRRSLWALVKTPSFSHQNLQGHRATVRLLREGQPGPGHSPVSVPQSSELSGQQAGQKRPHPPAGQGRLGDGPHPHVDVVRRPVQELEGVGQSEVVQNFSQFCCGVWNQESAEPPPGAVS